MDYEPSSEPRSKSSLDERLQRVAQTERTCRAFVLVVDGPSAGRLHLLGDDDRLIGRGESADIRIDDPLISHEHARISRRGDAYYISDLGSRNGTTVNGAEVAEARVRNRDRIGIATTVVMFLEEENPESTQTIAVDGDAVRGSRPPPSQALFDSVGVALPEARQEESPVIDLVRKALGVFDFIKRNRWFVIPLPLLGVALGAFSVTHYPPPETAAAEVKLTHFQQDNPVERNSYRRRSAPKVFFEDPERNFKNRELAEAALRTIGQEPAAGTVNQALKGLDIEVGKKGHYVASFSQPKNESSIPAIGFLEQYLDAYLVSEVDRALRVLKSEATFLETELSEVESELRSVEEELLVFQRAHIDSLPEQAGAAIEGKQALSMRKAELELEVEKYSVQASNAREQLSESRTTFARRFENTRPLQTQLETKERDRAALEAQGLKAEHPDVRKVTAQIDELRRQMNSKLESGVSEVEQKADPERLALRTQLADHEGNLRVAKSALGRVQQQLASASGKVAQVPEVQATIARLGRRQISLQELRAQLFEQHRKTLVQIDLETANVRARYEIVSPGALQNSLTKKFLALRVGGGLLAGLLLAFLIVGPLELRRLLRLHPELRRS